MGNGPGYSMLIVPFVALKLPLITITLLNAVFYYFTIVLIFKIASKFASFFKSFILSLFWVCYYNIYEWMPVVLPEVFGVFLVCLLFFLLVKVFEKQQAEKIHPFIGAYFWIPDFNQAYLWVCVALPDYCSGSTLAL